MHAVKYCAGMLYFIKGLISGSENLFLVKFLRMNRCIVIAATLLVIFDGMLFVDGCIGRDALHGIGMYCTTGTSILGTPSSAAGGTWSNLWVVQV